MKHYTGAIYTKPQDMYKTWELARLLYHDLTPELYKQYIDDITNDIRLEMRVVFNKEKPIAFVVMHRTPVLFLAGTKCLSMAHIAVDEIHRPAVSKFIYEWVEHDAKKAGVGAIDVRSQQTNVAADKFYKKNGFINTESFAWRKRIEGESSNRTMAKL